MRNLEGKEIQETHPYLEIKLIPYGVGFLLSEDLALGPGTRLDHSRAFVWQSFIKVRKRTEKPSDIDIRRGWRVPSKSHLFRKLLALVI